MNKISKIFHFIFNTEKTPRIGTFLEKLFLLGSLSLFFIFSLYSLSVILFFFGIPVQPLYFPISMILSFFFLYSQIKNERFIKRVYHSMVIYIIFLLLLTLFIVISVNIYDVSYDGQWYHQKGIVLMKQGWNPFRSYTNDYDGWILNHYAKCSWIFGASAYAFLGVIESVKFLNFLMVFISFCLVFVVLYRVVLKNVFWSLLLSILLALNPISLNQLFSFYLDGQLASSILIMLSLFVLILHGENFNKKILYFLLFISFVLLINYKITGTAYCFVFSVGFALYFLIKRKYLIFIKNALILALFFIIGVVIYGYNPYVTNTINFGHPFYPLNKIELGAQPANFKNANRFDKAFHAYFSKAGYCEAPNVTELKKFFDISDAEAFTDPGLRISGFGSLYNVILISTLIIILLTLAFYKDHKLKLLFFLVFIILISVFINPEFWWARYAPQLYFISIIVIIFPIYLTNNFFRKKIYLSIVFIITAFHLVILIINSYLIADVCISSNIRSTKEINNQLKFIKNKKVLANFSIYKANEIRFIENNIDYRQVQLDEMPANERVFMAGSISSFFCINDSLRIYQNLFCDCETIANPSRFYVVQPDSFRVEFGLLTQSDQFSYQGKFSEKPNEICPYGLTVILSNVRKGDKIVAKVYRFSEINKNSGSLVICSDNSEQQYSVTNVGTPTNKKDWDELTLTIYCENDLPANKIKIYVWNSSKYYNIYFDNLEVYHYKPSL